MYPRGIKFEVAVELIDLRHAEEKNGLTQANDGTYFRHGRNRAARFVRQDGCSSDVSEIARVGVHALGRYTSGDISCPSKRSEAGEIPRGRTGGKEGRDSSV